MVRNSLIKRSERMIATLMAIAVFATAEPAYAFAETGPVTGAETTDTETPGTEESVLAEEEPALESITIRPLLKNESQGIPRNNAIYVSSGVALLYDIEPEELQDEVTVTLSTDNSSAVAVKNEDNTIWGQSPGRAEITATAVYKVEGEPDQTATDSVIVDCVYPTGRIFEYYGKRYASDENSLYTGWLSVSGKNYYTEKKSGNFDVYYFEEDPTDIYYRKAVKGERQINGITYKFDDDCKLIREWIKLESIELQPVPAEANNTGEIFENTLSVGSNTVITAKLYPELANDDRDPEWIVSDEDAVRITSFVPEDAKPDELYATLEVLSLPADPSTPVTVTVKAGDEDNRITSTSTLHPAPPAVSPPLEIYVTYPVGWQKGEGGKTYYGEVRDIGSRKHVELVKGWWPNSFAQRNDVNAEYHFDETTGAMTTGIYEKEGVLYDFGEDGILKAEYENGGFVRVPGGVVCYKNDGTLNKGFIPDEDGNMYYFDEVTGFMTYGYFPVNDGGEKFYYALPEGDSNEGQLQSGWCVAGGRWRLFSDASATYPYSEIPSAYHDGWIQTGADDHFKRYYRNSKGKKLSGWQKVDGKKYHFEDDGSVTTGFFTDKGKIYYLGETLDWDLGNDEPGNADDLGIMKTGIVSVSGKDYLFDAYGVMQTGWQKSGDRIYHFDVTDGHSESVTRLYGPVTSPDGWWEYTDGSSRPHRAYFKSGKALKGWQNLPTVYTADNADARFFFDETGDLVYSDNGIITAGSGRYYTQEYVIGGVATHDVDFGGIMSPGFFKCSDKWYYSDKSGKLAKGKLTLKRDGKNYTYYFDTDSVLLTGVTDIAGKKYYLTDFADADAVKRDPSVYPEYASVAYGDKGVINAEKPAATYFANSSGVLQTGWRFAKTGSVYVPEYYSADTSKYGQKQNVAALDGESTGWFELSGDTSDTDGLYYIAGGKTLKKGNLKLEVTASDDSSKEFIFCLDPSTGKYNGAAGTVNIGGKAYFNAAMEAPFDAVPGYPHVAIVLGGVFSMGGKTYYTDKDGALVKGWSRIKEADDSYTWRYFRQSDGAELTATGIGSDKMVKAPDDTDMWGIINESGNTAAYYFSKGKTLCKNGWQTIDGYKHYFDAKGHVMSGGLVVISKKTYLLDDFSEKGRALDSGHSDADGLVHYSGNAYVTDKSGVLMTGWQTSKGKTYWCDPVTFVAQAPSWSGNWATLSDGSIYYFKNGKTLVKGIKDVAGSFADPSDTAVHKYCFNSNTGELAKADTGDGYVRFSEGSYSYEASETGALTSGWGMLYDNGGTLATRTETVNENIQADSFYDRNCRMVKNAFTEVKDVPSAGTYYFDKDGKMAVGKTTVNKKVYVLGVNTADISGYSILSKDRGKLHRNLYSGLDAADIAAGRKYCIDKSGVMLTGWQKVIDETDTLRWHYFDLTTGIENKGVYDTTGKWYIIKTDENGRLVRTKFYFTGKGPAKGFTKINGRTYYFDDTGRLATGLWNIGNSTYFFNDAVTDDEPHVEGELFAGGIYNSGGRYYFTTSSGAIKTGWFNDKAGRYHADPVTCALSTGFELIDGDVYYFSDVDSSIGQLQTGFIQLSYRGQVYYDTAPGASNRYYADKDGVIAGTGWKNIKINPKLSDSQEWSYYLDSERPGTDMGDFTLTGELTVGDVLIRDDGSVIYLDSGIGASDGFSVVPGVCTASDISDYYRFDPVTGARRKKIMYFYGNYYGILPIDDNQVRSVSTLSRYINSDMKYATETSDFVIVNAASDFPMCASNSIAEEKKDFVAANDLDHNGHVDVLDTEIYSQQKYDAFIAAYGPRNLVLMGASSGAGICLGLYDYAITKATTTNNPNLLPAQAVLISPWVDVSMSNTACYGLSASKTGSTNVSTLKYWGARYTRDKYYEDDNGVRPYRDPAVSGEGSKYVFASPIYSTNKGRMKNVYMYSGTYDPCYFDCALFVEQANSAGNDEVFLNSYSYQRHGFAFFAGNKSATEASVDACRKVMTE